MYTHAWCTVYTRSMMYTHAWCTHMHGVLMSACSQCVHLSMFMSTSSLFATESSQMYISIEICKTVSMQIFFRTITKTCPLIKQNYACNHTYQYWPINAMKIFQANNLTGSYWCETAVTSRNNLDKEDQIFSLCSAAVSIYVKEQSDVFIRVTEGDWHLKSAVLQVTQSTHARRGTWAAKLATVCFLIGKHTSVPCGS